MPESREEKCDVFILKLSCSRHRQKWKCDEIRVGLKACGVGVYNSRSLFPNCSCLCLSLLNFASHFSTAVRLSAVSCLGHGICIYLFAYGVLGEFFNIHPIHVEPQVFVVVKEDLSLRKGAGKYPWKRGLGQLKSFSVALFSVHLLLFLCVASALLLWIVLERARFTAWIITQEVFSFHCFLNVRKWRSWNQATLNAVCTGLQRGLEGSVLYLLPVMGCKPHLISCNGVSLLEMEAAFPSPAERDPLRVCLLGCLWSYHLCKHDRALERWVSCLGCAIIFQC